MDDHVNNQVSNQSKKSNKVGFGVAVKSKEFRIFLYFFLIFLIITVISGIYKGYLDKDTKYLWTYGDFDNNGSVEEWEAVGYLFGGFLEDVVKSVGKLLAILPLYIKQAGIVVCLILQIIAVIVKKGKKVLTNIAIAISIVNSAISLLCGVFGMAWIFDVVFIVDIVISIILLCFINRKETDLNELGNKSTSITLGVTSLVLGILSIVLMCFIILSCLCAVGSILFGILSLCKEKNKLGIAGIVLGSIYIVLYVVCLFLEQIFL